ncbi:hypothetical protein Salmuc_01317 [Salipiger mucosus DSM 16094]|uniref:Uncharacterized protein n=2 Tax=Salipiger mucosus TaxID=263378 RepID=S9SEP1_9RHOB|nr:hypothetical protein Salmuc_01317 [Salipiger mucosus DSM 16094]
MVAGYYTWEDEYRHIEDIVREAPAMIDRFLEDREAGISDRGKHGSMTPILNPTEGVFSPSGVQVGMHMYPGLLVSGWRDRRTTEDDRQSKLRSVIEAELFDGSMNALGRHYAPQNNSGQDVEWGLHEEIAQITLKHIQERRHDLEDVDEPAP